MICNVAGMDGKVSVYCAFGKPNLLDFDMQLFNDGDYLRAMEQNALAEAIHKGNCIRVIITKRVKVCV